MRNTDYLGNSNLIREQTLARKRAEFAQEVEASFTLKLSEIDPNPFQPRIDFSAVEAMAQSLRDHGQYYPVLVRRVGDRYQVADGETRLRAAKLNLERDASGPNTIKALLRSYSDVEMAIIAFRTAYDRKQLNPVEEARGLHKLHAELNIEYQELARQLGKTESYIYERTRLLGLHPLLIAEVEQETLSATAAIKLNGLDLKKEDELARVLDLVKSEKLTVHAIQEQKARLLKVAKEESPDAQAEAEDDGRALWRDLQTIWKHLPAEARKNLVETASKLAAASMTTELKPRARRSRKQAG